MDVRNPHDKFFKETFGNVETAKDFLRNYLPEKLLRVIDVHTLEVQKDSFVNENLQESQSDLLFKANIAGEESYIYFLFEHKSYPDQNISLQLLKYMTEIWQAKQKKAKDNKLPIIIPLVIYHGHTKWNIPARLGEVLLGYEKLEEEVKQYVPNFSYLLYDLSRYSDEEIKGNILLCVTLMMMRDILTKRGESLLKAIDRALEVLFQLGDEQKGVVYLKTMILYVASAGKDITEKDAEHIQKKIESSKWKGSEIIMTLADIWREQGIEIGKEIGKTEALLQIAIFQLESKFGAIPENLKEKILEADVSALEKLLKEIFVIENIEDVKRFLN